MDSSTTAGGLGLPDDLRAYRAGAAAPTARRTHSRDHGRIAYGDKDEAGEITDLEPLRALLPSGPNLAQTKRAAQLDTRYNQTRAPKPHVPKPARGEGNWIGQSAAL